MIYDIYIYIYIYMIYDSIKRDWAILYPLNPGGICTDSETSRATVAGTHPSKENQIFTGDDVIVCLKSKGVLFSLRNTFLRLKSKVLHQFFFPLWCGNTYFPQLCCRSRFLHCVLNLLQNVLQCSASKRCWTMLTCGLVPYSNNSRWKSKLSRRLIEVKYQFV